MKKSRLPILMLPALLLFTAPLAAQDGAERTRADAGTAAGAAAAADTDISKESPMSSILVHITHGPEHPTRAALGFLVAKSAIEEGHDVTLFLAGDAVQLLRDGALASINGLGTGNLQEAYDAIVEAGGRFYLSGMSSAARGLSPEDLAGKPAEMAQPNVLVRLAVEHDRMFTY